MTKNTEKMVAEGVIMGIISAVISLKFLGVDAYLFDLDPPQWATNLSNMIPMSGIMIDLLMTIDLLLLLVLFVQQGEKE